MSAGLEELKARGFIQQCTNIELLEKKLNDGPVTFYCGFDPTGPSLHAGHLIPLFAMAHLFKAGHRAIALVGGGTALIGDPSGKTEMRKMQTKEQIRDNGVKIKAQIQKFINFDSDNAILLDNTEWLAGLNYIDFLRDIGKHFSVNRMLSFETYKMRLETGLSFIEFNYQLLQSYDFLVLYQKQGCSLQIGGDDQWGNIVAGADLTRRIEGAEVIGLTFPLVTRSDGRKMGKTEKGSLFLDPTMAAPYEFYQYWRNVADPDAGKFLRLYTFLPLDEIEKLASLEGREVNTAKEVLAFELTAIVHGKDEAEKAREAAAGAFSDQPGTAESDVSSIPSIQISRPEIDAGIPVLDLFSKTSLCASKSDARRLVVQGGASINDVKIDDIELMVDADWIRDGKLMLRAGKKRYFQVIIEKAGSE